MTPYYDKDGITLYCGDCRDVLPTLKADVMLTDPPYGIDYRSNWGELDRGYCDVAVKRLERERSQLTLFARGAT